MSELISAAAALRSINGKLMRRLRESAPPGDLTWPQVSVLGYLVRDGAMTVTELAAREGVRSQSKCHRSQPADAGPGTGRGRCAGWPQNPLSAYRCLPAAHRQQSRPA